MHGLFREAGLKNISEKEVSGKLNSGTKEVFWNMMTEVGAPIVAALGQANEALKEKIKQEVFGLLDQKFAGGSVSIDSGALVIYGEK